MSWKRCWNGGGVGYPGHGFYDSEDEQIVPDIDRRTSSSSSSSSLSSNSSATSVETASSLSPRGGIDTYHHQAQPSTSSSPLTMYRPVSSSSASSYRTFPSKRTDTFRSSLGNNSQSSNEGRIFGQNRAHDTGRTSPSSDRCHSHYSVFGLKTTPSYSTHSSVSSNSSMPPPFSCANKSTHDRGFFGERPLPGNSQDN